MTTLAMLHCTALDGQGAMTDADVAVHLERVDGWTLVDGAIEKTVRFTDFHRTMAYVNAVAWIAHREDHHPDICLGYNHCTMRWSTHSVKGISINDFICAAKVDTLAS